jgi:hypothetical protein
VRYWDEDLPNDILTRFESLRDGKGVDALGRSEALDGGPSSVCSLAGLSNLEPDGAEES